MATKSKKEHLTKTLAVSDCWFLICIVSPVEELLHSSPSICAFAAEGRNSGSQVRLCSSLGEGDLFLFSVAVLLLFYLFQFSGLTVSRVTQTDVHFLLGEIFHDWKININSSDNQYKCG